MNRYAKLWHKSGESPDIGEALETNPLAVSLFCLSLPRADLYGILPGEARRYRAAVAPAAILTADVVEEAIQEQERRGWVVRYADSAGETLLYIRHYHLYQEVRWRNGVGPPEHELPECWEPTRDFLRWIADQRCIDSRKHGPQWQALRERYGSATVVDASEVGSLRESHRTADSRQQTHTQNDVTPFVGTAVAVPPLPPDGASEKPTEPTPAADPQPRTSLKRKRRSDAELAADTQAIREKLPETLLPTLDLWLDNLASHNNTGALTAGRTLSETQGFADLVLVHGLTEGAIRHGVTQALTRTDRRDGKPGVTSVAFVLEVAAGFKAGGNGAAKRIELPDDLAPPTVDPFREMDIRAGRTAR